MRGVYKVGLTFIYLPVKRRENLVLQEKIFAELWRVYKSDGMSAEAKAQRKKILEKYLPC